VRRRFYRSIKNFWALYRKMSDILVLYSNMEQSILVAKFANGETEILVDEKYDQFLRMV
jgi:hypothetical protein